MRQPRIFFSHFYFLSSPLLVWDVAPCWPLKQKQDSGFRSGSYIHLLHHLRHKDMHEVFLLLLSREHVLMVWLNFVVGNRVWLRLRLLSWNPSDNLQLTDTFLCFPSHPQSIWGGFPVRDRQQQPRVWMGESSSSLWLQSKNQQAGEGCFPNALCADLSQTDTSSSLEHVAGGS